MKHWKSEYLENNIKESHVYLFTSLEIKNYLHKFFKDHGLTLHNYQINFLDSTLDLFISYYRTSKSIPLIQKINFKQKIKIKKKRFHKKLYINSENNTNFIKNTRNLKKRVKNYYFKTNSFVKKKIFNIFNILELLKLDYYSLRKKKNKKKIFFKEKKNILERYYTNYYNYQRYLLFLFFKKKSKSSQKRIQALKYYKTYLNIKEYKTFHNFNLNNFIGKLMEGLTLFTGNKFNIFLTLQQVNRDIKFLKTQYFKRILSKLRKFQRGSFFNEGVNVLFNAISQKNSADLITNYVASQLKFMKRHKFFFAFLIKTLTLLLDQKFSKISGLKLIIKGRINNAARSKFKKINIGKISLITVSSRIIHSQSTSYGPNGTFGIKVWVCEK